MKTARATLCVFLFLNTAFFGDAEISLKSQKWVQCLAFSPDGQRVVAGNDEGRLWVVDARTAKTGMRIKDVGSAPTAVAWSHKGTLIAVGGWRGEVHVCQAKSGKVLARWRGHKENITSIIFSRVTSTLPPVVVMTQPRCECARQFDESDRNDDDQLDRNEFIDWLNRKSGGKEK